MQFYTDNILIIFILPLIAAGIAFVAHISKFEISKSTVCYSTIVSTLVGLIFSIALFYCYNYTDTQSFETSLSWLKIENLNLSFGILFDGVSTLFLLILMLVSIIVQWYSTSYLEDDKNFNLYFCLLNLFNIAMAGLVLSSNLPQTYIFWEAVGVCSYLLINFYYQKTQASNAAKKVFIINRIGDTMFLTGIVILIYFLINYPINEGDVLLAYSSLPETAADFYVYLSDISFYIACILLFGGVIAKSAQFPLHVWLIDAMQAPTPVSALIHAATMVAAGIFLTVRLLPMFELSVYVLNTIIYIGLITAVFCAFFAIGQSDIKKMLAYSTSSQLGLMIAGIGALAPASSLFYLSTHAFNKALLFLIAGALIKFVADGSRDMTKMGNCRKDYPVLAICYAIAVISLSGIFFGGFFAKDEIFMSLAKLNQVPALVLFGITLFMTSYYLFKSYFIIFEGTDKQREKVEIPTAVKYSIIVCTVLSVIVMFFQAGNLEQLNRHLTDETSLLNEPTTIFISLFIAILGAILSCSIVAHKMNPLPEVLKRLSSNGGYLDKIYTWVIDNIFDVFRTLAKNIDKYIIDAFVNLQGYLARLVSWCISVTQNGNIQAYLSYSILTIGLMLVLYVLLIIGFGEI